MNTRYLFQDTTIYIDEHDRTLQTKAYYTLTNLYSYLAYNSGYPLSLKNSLPFSQGVKFKRITSKTHDLLPELQNLWKIFRNRGFPDGSLKITAEKLRNLDRECTSTSNKKEEKI